MQQVGDDVLLVRPDAVDTIDEKNGRAGRANFGKQVDRVTVAKTQSSCKREPTYALKAVVL